MGCLRHHRAPRVRQSMDLQFPRPLQSPFCISYFRQRGCHLKRHCFHYRRSHHRVDVLAARHLLVRPGQPSLLLSRRQCRNTCQYWGPSSGIGISTRFGCGLSQRRTEHKMVCPSSWRRGNFLCALLQLSGTFGYQGGCL